MTSSSHLQRDHEEGPKISRDHQYLEWARDKEKCAEVDIAKRVHELQDINYSIHFDVWDALTFMSFLSEAKHHYDIPIQLCAAIADRDELIVILRKIA